MKKVHVRGVWNYPGETECGVPRHPKRRIKIATDLNKVTCLKCLKILGLGIKEER